MVVSNLSIFVFVVAVPSAVSLLSSRRLTAGISLVLRLARRRSSSPLRPESCWVRVHVPFWPSVNRFVGPVQVRVFLATVPSVDIFSTIVVVAVLVLTTLFVSPLMQMLVFLVGNDVFVDFAKVVVPGRVAPRYDVLEVAAHLVILLVHCFALWLEDQVLVCL